MKVPDYSIDSGSGGIYEIRPGCLIHDNLLDVFQNSRLDKSFNATMNLKVSIVGTAYIQTMLADTEYF